MVDWCVVHDAVSEGNLDFIIAHINSVQGMASEVHWVTVQAASRGQLEILKYTTPWAQPMTLHAALIRALNYDHQNIVDFLIPFLQPELVRQYI